MHCGFAGLILNSADDGFEIFSWWLYDFKLVILNQRRLHVDNRRTAPKSCLTLKAQNTTAADVLQATCFLCFFLDVLGKQCLIYDVNCNQTIHIKYQILTCVDSNEPLQPPNGVQSVG